MQKLKKLLIITISILSIIVLYFIYDYYIYGGNPFIRFYDKYLYPNIPYLQMANVAKIEQEMNACLESGGVWKLKKTCSQLTYNKNHPKPEDFACYKRYKDGGKPCNSSSQCEGYCRFNDFIIQPLIGVCDETSEPTCCNDIIENQTDPDFTKCYANP